MAERERILKLLTSMEEATLLAAAHMLQSFASSAVIEQRYKSDASLVLNIDLESQKIITEKLKSYLPIVAEEDEASHHLLGQAQDFFLIDPLDGTTSCKRFKNQVGGQVGFGPLVGVVLEGKLEASCFYNLPQRTLCSAVRGAGAYEIEVSADSLKTAHPLPPFSKRSRLPIQAVNKLLDCAVLFYPGVNAEVSIVEKLRAQNKVENVYRFGGFANDCQRLARGSEQLQIQFSVKAWDYSAVLFPYETGYTITVQPFGRRENFEVWNVELNNPLIVAPQGLSEELFQFIEREFPKGVKI